MQCSVRFSAQLLIGVVACLTRELHKLFVYFGE